MSEFVWSWEGERYFVADVLFGSDTPLDLTLRLFTNNIVPAKSHVFSDLTEALGSWGYSAATMSRTSGWTKTIGSSGVYTNAELTTGHEFTFTSWTSGTYYIYGYYISYSNGGDRLVGAERFDSRQLVRATTSITVQPKMNLGDLAE